MITLTDNKVNAFAGLMGWASWILGDDGTKPKIFDEAEIGNGQCLFVENVDNPVGME